MVEYDVVYIDFNLHAKRTLNTQAGRGWRLVTISGHWAVFERPSERHDYRVEVPAQGDQPAENG